MEIKILYEDEYLVICEKPIGLPSQLCADGSDSMPKRLSEYFQGKGAEGYVGVVHRLDTATGGIIMYSRSEKHTGVISNLVADGGYKKQYLAVADGEIEQENGSMVDFLYHDRIKNKSYAVSGERRGAKRAELEYEKLAVAENDRGEKKSLLKIKLLTGRTHQIRVQLASRRHSLAGDGKYGSRDNRCGTALWSWRCEFIHPVTRKMVAAESLPPRCYPWSVFDISEFSE